MAEQQQIQKKKKSALQILKSSPFYRNVSGRLSLNDKRPKNGPLLNGGLLPKLNFLRPTSDPGAISPSDDDGGFATWSGSCDRLAQIRDIIRRRSEAIANERVIKSSQSAYTLPDHDDTESNGPFIHTSPARPTTLPNQSRKNESWIPPGTSAARSDSPNNRHSFEYNQVISSFPFYTPPTPIASRDAPRIITPVYHQPQTVTTPVVRPGGQMSRNPPGRPHSLAGTLELARLIEQSPKQRPHSIIGIDTQSWSPIQNRITPTTSATSPSDSGYRSLPSATSDYQLKSPSTTAAGTVQSSTFNSLPLNSSRRLSLPNTARSTTTPRPSPTFHGLPFRPAGCTTPNLMILAPTTPRAPANTPTKAQFAHNSRALNSLDDKLALLFDILDTQERFAKVT
ncbi:hypothetical protein O3M35_003445 [Rhynocoris fuscipes]|uniref:Uncharacterized protein n=1 Tax=Rhynocoris fuscipes TaxID=488301 RepID=A0AAW1CRL3_9HEMI